MKPVVIRWLLSAQDGRSHAVTDTPGSPIGTVTARCGHQLQSFEPASPRPHSGVMCQNCGTSVLDEVIAPPHFPTTI
jgi:hypothetical protein